METISYLDENGALDPSYKHLIDNEILKKAYRAMCLTRQMDERMIILQRQGIISFALSSKGEEAAAVGSAAALEPGDWMYPQYREAGIMFYRGATPEEYVHQMFGDSKDPVQGRQMPNHFGFRKLNIVTVSSPIGTKIPHAAGCAYAMKLQRDPHVAIVYFGEGASSEGDFHVGLSFAAVRKVPCIFFCRNNGYAISTPASRQFATDGVAPQGPGHGIETYRIDGNDFFAVYDAVKRAREYCLAGNGPVLIEAMTYRMGAHSTSDDPSRYRDEKEAKEWERRCPIRRLRLYLESKGVDTSADFDAAITEAIQIAKETAPPPDESLIRDVYSDIPDKLKEQLRWLK